MHNPATKESASVKLLELNTKLHQSLADIANELKVKEDIAIIPYAPLKAAYDAGIDAETILLKIKPAPEQLKKVKALTTAIDKVFGFYPEKEGFLTIPANIANDLTALIINHLAAQVHDAAMELIGATGQIGACAVSEVLPDEAKAVSKYCGGVLPKISNAVVSKVPTKKKTIAGQTIMLKNPQLIIHKLGLHKTEVSPLSKDGTAKVGIEYHESHHYDDSKTRGVGVQKRLEKEGFICEDAYPILYCHGEVDKDKLRRLATFFSLLLNADVAHMGKDTVGVVSDKVWDIAGKLNQQHGDDTWQSGEGQPDWSSVHHQWLQEKEIYEKEAIYKDLRQITILRDKHHQIEAKYGLHVGKASLEGTKAIADNAKEAIALFKKHKWSTHGMLTHLSQLEKVVASGIAKPVLGTSDMVGHEMHLALAAVLDKEGTYGGCSMAGDIVNINAGNLAYCEGVLKGTSVSFTKVGNLAHHKVAPKTYLSFILDEDPEGGYHVTLTLPGPTEWGGQLSKYLTDNFGTVCDGPTCKVYIKSLDDIRELALFFSNLRAASEVIGTDCIFKAFDEAATVAKSHNEKGVFAFTQEPIMANAKAWINLCHKKYGILPPGLTEEEKILLELLGPEKVYAGCSFEKTDIIPNKGILAYCEGVRKNPVSSINAILAADGQLDHYFHTEPGALDRIARVNIIPLGDNKYQVGLTNIDMRGPYLLDEVIKKLKTNDFTCPTNTECSRELPEGALRTLAKFLSSLHHAFHLTPECTTAAVEYVQEKIKEIPSDKTAHEYEVYPFTKEHWDKEVCAKIEVVPKPPAKPPIEKPPVKEYKPGYPVPKPPFWVGGCTSLTKAKPTKVKYNYCSGVIGKFKSLGVETEFKLPGLLPGTAATLGVKENVHNIGGPKVVFDSKWNTIYITLPPELAEIKPLVDKLIAHPFWFKTTDNKTFQGFSYSAKTRRLAQLLSYLSSIHTLPEWCHEAAVKYAADKVEAPGYPPIYPYAKKDWMEEVCEEVKPPEEEEYWSVSSEDIAAITGFKAIIQNMWNEGEKMPAIKDYLHKKYHLLYDAALDYLVLESLEEIGVKPPEVKPTLSPQALKDQVFTIFEHAPDKKTDYTSLVMAIQEYYDVESGPADKEGTIAWALDALVKEGKAAFFKGTIYGLPEKPKPKVGELEQAILKFLKQTSPAEWSTEEDIASWLKEHYDVSNVVISVAIQKLLNEGKIIKGPLGYKLVEKPPIEELIEKSCNYAQKLANALTDKEWKTAGETKEYKKLPKAIKDYLHAFLNCKLLISHKNKIPYDEFLKFAEYMIINPTNFNVPITPLMVKLQTDIEKKKKIRRGELPPEPGEVVAKFYEGLSDEEQANVNEYISETIKGDPTYWIAQKGLLGAKVLEEFGIEYDDLLGTMINLIAQAEAPPIEVKKPTHVSDLSEDEQDEINKSIALFYSIGAPADQVAGEIEGDYPALNYPDLLDYVIKKMGEYAVKEKVIEEEKPHYEDLSSEEQEEIEGFIKAWAAVGKDVTVLINAVKENFNLEESTLLHKLVSGAVEQFAPKPPIPKVVEAINIIKGGDDYAGCRPVFKGIELNTPLITYCEGILTPAEKKIAGFVDEKDDKPTISQYGDGYRVDVKTETIELAHTLFLLFEDTEKTGKEWKKRQQSVAERLTEELGYTCAFLDAKVTCSRSGSDGEELKKKDSEIIRTTAIFMSKLHGIDSVEAGCVDECVRVALTEAKLTSKNLQAQSFKQQLYPFTVEEWNKEVCEKIIKKPVRIEAKDLAAQLGTPGLLKVAFEMGVDTSGSDEILAKKILEAGYLPGII